MKWRPNQFHSMFSSQNGNRDKNHSIPERNDGIKDINNRSASPHLTVACNRIHVTNGWVPALSSIISFGFLKDAEIFLGIHRVLLKSTITSALH